MSFESYESFTPEQKKQLEPFVSNCDSHIFVLKNLPEVVKGALFSKYSRSYLGLRSLLLKEFLQTSDSGFSTSPTDSTTLQEESIRKAQDFYDRILDGYGDDSIGELGGAHLAVENVSMLAAKHIEDCRIGGSPIEKSTRYIYFDRKINGLYPYCREKTLMSSRWAKLYEETCDHLFETYSKLIEPLTTHIQMSFPKDPQISEGAYQAALRAKVLDCLRGLLPAATLTNLGVFGNGRFFEKLLSDLSLSSLEEMAHIGTKAHNDLSEVIPSFVRRASPSNRHWSATATYREQLRQIIQKQNCQLTGSRELSNMPPHVKLLDIDPTAVKRVARALAFECSQVEFDELKTPSDQLFEAMGAIRTNRRHKSPRALELAFYTFEIEADFGAYRDLQRHRMLTQERQLLSCRIGYTIPSEIEEAGLEEPYRLALEAAKSAYDQIAVEMPEQAQYIVPMAYHIRWYYHINLRSIQWLCELRSAAAGHSAYRYIAQEMARLVSDAHPPFAPLLKFVDYQGHTLGRIAQESRRNNSEQNRSGQAC